MKVVEVLILKLEYEVLYYMPVPELLIKVGDQTMIVKVIDSKKCYLIATCSGNDLKLYY